MRVQRSCEALEKGCCLEVYYDGHSLIVEPHAVGFDKYDHAALLAWERFGDGPHATGQWLFLRLDETRKVAVSGYFSEVPRPGYCQDDARFDRVLCQV